MAELRSESTTEAGQLDKAESITTNGIAEPTNNATPTIKSEKSTRSKDKKDKKRSSDKKHKSKKISKYTDSSSSASEGEADDSNSSSDDSSSSSDEDRRKKKDRKKAKLKSNKKKPVVGKSKKHIKAKTQNSSSSSSDSSSDSSSSESEKEADRRKREKQKRTKPVSSDSSSSSDAEDKTGGTAGNGDFKAKFIELLDQMMDEKSKSKSKAKEDKQKKKDKKKEKEREEEKSNEDNSGRDGVRKEKPKKKRGSIEEYKRVDQLWDTDIHDYKLTESKDRERSEEFDEYTFTVRRVFNWENKYQETVVDIKSKYLKEALQEIMKDVKGISLEEDKPSLDPKMLFLYLEEMRTFYKKTVKTRLKKAKKSKHTKRLNKIRIGIKLLVKYLDEDYDETKKKLYPMLENGQITFDLLWALFKPNTIAYTSTYGASEHPRCYKVDFANKESSFTRGEWYSIEGRYLEYDGKSFGFGDFEANIEKFPGSRKITSLAAYPLSYHNDPEGTRKMLVERGRKFVDLAGMKYKYHEGMSFHKKKRQVLRLNTNGRCMVDPNMFRRILPNYPISILTPKNRDDDDEDGAPATQEGSNEFDGGSHERGDGDGDVRTATRVVRDKDGDYKVVDVPVDESGKEVRLGAHETLGASDPKERVFSEEEYLIASPVVLGFAFSEKQWMEFTVSGVREIDWNDDAFDSLVIPEDRKSIVKALVSAHKFKASKTIDDVVQGKGRGLVFVLHGPPGCGKTLTCEAIAELLRCPLYSVTAGDLGLGSHEIETELNRIMQVAQAWGAVLLLDEADVFLEKRQVQDVARNALVSVFLRLLEYFQGVLFLTTNRVDTFDDAFQSRIHLPLRYEELSFKAKREIWRMFLQRVQVMEVKHHDEDNAEKNKTGAVPVVAITQDSTPEANGTSENDKPAVGLESMFTDADLNALARNALNGRQIKNTVRTAQAIAVNENQRLSLAHIKRVLEVTEAFDRELKGGTGYLDAMRSYT